jgi:arylsulfatase A-like enzyme
VAHTDALDRRTFIRQLGLGSAGLAGAAAFGGFPGQPRRSPNIVLILADDMGYSDIGCFGGEIETPSIDRLASRGLRFTHVHNTARCCPSRASLLTGLYPHQAGVGHMMRDGGVDGYRGDLNARCVTIAEALGPAGYRAYASGKWHVTRFLPPEGPRHSWPLQRGFDRYFGIVTGAASYYEPDTLLRDNDPIEPGEGFFLTDAIADHAVECIRDHRRAHADRPFFSYVSFTAPHWPLHARAAEIDAQRGRFDAGWDVLRERRYRRMIEMGLVDPRWRLSPRDARVPAWADAPDKAWQLRRMEVYAAQVHGMDRAIGRITAELERQGALDDTLIVFLSDNGGCHEELTPSWGNYLVRGRERVARARTRDGRAVQFVNDPAVLPGPDDTYQSYGYPWANLSNTPYRLFKVSTHAGGVNTPLVVHWPARIQARGDLRRHTGHLIDLMPTCLEAAGAAYPSARQGTAVTPMEGRSLVPAFDNEPIARDAIYFEHEGNRAVIAGSHKLVSQGANGPWELYDVEADRTELTDLAASKPDLVKALAARWDEWARRTAVLPRPSAGDAP